MCIHQLSGLCTDTMDVLAVVMKARIHALCQATRKLPVELPASSMRQLPVGCIIGNCKVTGKIVTVAQLIKE